MLASPHITDNIHPMGHRISHQNSRSQSSSLNQVPPHLSGSVRSTKPIDVKSKPAPLPQDYARDIKKHQEDMKRKAAHECNFRDGHFTSIDSVHFNFLIPCLPTHLGNNS